MERPAASTSGSIPVDAPPQLLMQAVFVGPALALVFAFLALCCPRTPWPCRFLQTPKWQKVPAGWLVGCAVCQLPCIFLLMAFAFPALLLMGDVCASGANVGYAVVLTAPDLCTSAALGGVGTNTDCLVSKSARLMGNVSVSISATLPCDPSIAASSL